jgi:hypothetical protein
MWLKGVLSGACANQIIVVMIVAVDILVMIEVYITSKCFFILRTITISLISFDLPNNIFSPVPGHVWIK